MEWKNFIEIITVIHRHGVYQFQWHFLEKGVNIFKVNNKDTRKYQ